MNGGRPNPTTSIPKVGSLLTCFFTAFLPNYMLQRFDGSYLRTMHAEGEERVPKKSTSQSKKKPRAEAGEECVPQKNTSQSQKKPKSNAGHDKAVELSEVEKDALELCAGIDFSLQLFAVAAQQTVSELHSRASGDNKKQDSAVVFGRGKPLGVDIISSVRCWKVKVLQVTDYGTRPSPMSQKLYNMWVPAPPTVPQEWQKVKNIRRVSASNLFGITQRSCIISMCITAMTT